MENILKELEQLSQQGVDTYSLADRQRVIQLRIEFAKAISLIKKQKKQAKRKISKYKADQMQILKNSEIKISVEDRKSQIELQEGYIQLEDEFDEYEYKFDLCDIIKDTFSELQTLMRDAIKVIEAQTA